MKRQARPFVVETKRSRKAPANLWASTPLLQQELAAASAPEPKADAIFAERSKDRTAEPARRILQSLIVEAPSPVFEALESEDAQDALPRRRRAVRPDDEAKAEPARRGRPRRAAAEHADDAEASPSAGAAGARSRKLVATPALDTKTLAARGGSPGKAAPRPTASASAGPSTKSTAKTGPLARPAAPIAVTPRADAGAEPDDVAVPRAARSRTPRNAAAAALLPGERWKRRLPQRLW